MTLEEAKEAVAFKYYREKWKTLSPNDVVTRWEEVAELYTENKVKNILGNEKILYAITKSNSI